VSPGADFSVQKFCKIRLQPAYYPRHRWGSSYNASLEYHYYNTFVAITHEKVNSVTRTVTAKISKWSTIQDYCQITPKIKSLVVCAMPYNFLSYLANRQTNKNRQKHYLLGGGNKFPEQINRSRKREVQIAIRWLTGKKPQKFWHSSTMCVGVGQLSLYSCCVLQSVSASMQLFRRWWVGLAFPLGSGSGTWQGWCDCNTHAAGLLISLGTDLARWFSVDTNNPLVSPTACWCYQVKEVSVAVHFAVPTMTV